MHTPFLLHSDQPRVRIHLQSVCVAKKKINVFERSRYARSRTVHARTEAVVPARGRFVVVREQYVPARDRSVLMVRCALEQGQPASDAIRDAPAVDQYAA